MVHLLVNDMVKITGTKGNVVSFEIRGINETLRLLRATGKKIESAADFGVIKAASFIEGEVKESVSGKRAEHKSVDTGDFIRDIQVKKIKKAEAKVHAPNTPYANHVEFSDRIKGGPRLHFRNTEKRNKKNVKNIIDTEIKNSIAARIKVFGK